jgi:acetoin utilization deacetylase AcuC-like enzyme
MATLLLDLAQKHSSGKIAFLLEGGYDLEALRNSVAVVLEKMKGEGRSEPPVQGDRNRVDSLIREILKVQEKYW